MELNIELYPDCALERSHAIPLVDVVRPVILRWVGYRIDGFFFYFYLVPVPELEKPDATVVNMAPDYGYAVVHVYDRRGHLHYRHPHPLTEMIAEPLTRLLRRDFPEQDRWGYRLTGSELPELPLVRPTPRVAGSDLVRRENGERARFRIRKMEEEPPPIARLADYGIESDRGDGGAPVRVLLHGPVLETFMGGRPFSSEVEEGGFMIGRLFRDGDRPDNWLAEITSVPKASHSGASLLHFTFTGDSFAEIKRDLPADRNLRRLLGWYHTHLFAAREEMGLSSIDLDLHFTTFRYPWQLAGLLNLEKGGRRTLRFYVRNGQTMIQCPYWSIEPADVRIREASP